MVVQRQIVINGEQVILSVVGSPLEPAIEQFYIEGLNGQPLPWNDVATAARVYFDSSPGEPQAHDAYFNNFISLWRILLTKQAFDSAERVWERALQPALDWESINPRRCIHKGTPYYFWAMTVILRRDMDRGYLLAHRALQEDIRTSGQPTPDTPGFALVSLDHAKPDQAFKPWVDAQAHYLQRLLDNYNATHGRTLTLLDVKAKFLSNPPGIEALFLFTHTLARLVNITDLPDHVTGNAFAGQLQLNLCFDITLVIDATIKRANHAKWKFIDHAECLLVASGHPLNAHRLGEINGLFDTNFDDTVQRALDGTLILSSGVMNRQQCDVALAYGLRNYGAHHTGTAPSIWRHFVEVQQTLFRVFFATIDFL
jgi:hypothetical protein